MQDEELLTQLLCNAVRDFRATERVVLDVARVKKNLRKSVPSVTITDDAPFQKCLRDYLSTKQRISYLTKRHKQDTQPVKQQINQYTRHVTQFLVKHKLEKKEITFKMGENGKFHQKSYLVLKHKAQPKPRLTVAVLNECLAEHIATLVQQNGDSITAHTDPSVIGHLLHDLVERVETDLAAKMDGACDKDGKNTEDMQEARWY